MKGTSKFLDISIKLAKIESLGLKEFNLLSYGIDITPLSREPWNKIDQQMRVLCFMGQELHLHNRYTTVNKDSTLDLHKQECGVEEIISLKNLLIQMISLIKIIRESFKCFMRGY